MIPSIIIISLSNNKELSVDPCSSSSPFFVRFAPRSVLGPRSSRLLPPRSASSTLTQSPCPMPSNCTLDKPSEAFGTCALSCRDCLLCRRDDDHQAHDARCRTSPSTTVPSVSVCAVPPLHVSGHALRTVRPPPRRRFLVVLVLYFFSVPRKAVLGKQPNTSWFLACSFARLARLPKRRNLDGTVAQQQGRWDTSASVGKDEVGREASESTSFRLSSTLMKSARQEQGGSPLAYVDPRPT